MSARVGDMSRICRMPRTILVILIALTVLAACRRETETAAPQPRPVRTVTVEKREAGTPLTFTGRVEAEDEVSLSFRIAGRLIETNGKLGDRLQPGQVVAR